MPTTTWTLNIDHQKHTVSVKQNILTMERQVWVDGSRVPLKKKTELYNSRDVITLAGRDFEVAILSDGFRYFRYLMDGTTPILSDKDVKAGKTTADLLKQRMLVDVPFWNDLSRLLGLSYMPIRDAMWPYRHRLLGLRGGYMVFVQKALLAQYKPGWYILVRHEMLASDEAGEKIRSDPRVAALLEKDKNKKNCASHAAITEIVLPGVKGETAAELVVRVQSFLSAVAAYTRPLPVGVCENQDCKHPTSGDPKWILWDGSPHYYCPGCISAIPGYLMKAEEAYERAPNNLAQGLLAGLGAAMLVALLWAVFALLLNMVFVAIAFAAVALIAYEMDKAGAKRSNVTMVIAALLALVSVTIGTWLTEFLIAIRIGAPLAVETLGMAWQYILAEPGNLKVAGIFTLIGAALYLVPLGLNQKKLKAQAFKAKIEEIQGVS